jgi:hypothetical protein
MMYRPVKRYRKIDYQPITQCPTCGNEAVGNYKHVEGFFKCTNPDCHRVFKASDINPCKGLYDRWIIYTPDPGTREFKQAIFFAHKLSGTDHVGLKGNLKITTLMTARYTRCRLATDQEIVMARMSGDIE